jgi:hypothetical protein
MAASPGNRAPDMAKRELEASYSAALREFEPEEVLSLISIGEASFINLVSTMEGGDVLATGVSDSALSLRMNRAVYDDDAEDFIAESDALLELIKRSRQDASHEGAERVRLLRSARYCIWAASQQTEVRRAS